jgi:hypothetical protein
VIEAASVRSRSLGDTDTLNSHSVADHSFASPSYAADLLSRGFTSRLQSRLARLVVIRCSVGPRSACACWRTADASRGGGARLPTADRRLCCLWQHNRRRIKPPSGWSPPSCPVDRAPGRS